MVAGENTWGFSYRLPNYVPTADELDAVRGAVYPENPAAAYNPRGPFNPNYPERSIDKLIEDFETMALTGVLPPGVSIHDIPDNLNLPTNERSRVLAIALAILRPSWNADEVHCEFIQMRKRLLAAWRASHGPVEKRRKTIDEVVAFGSLQAPVPGWPLAHEIIAREIVGACRSAANSFEPPNGVGLIPGLTASWGTPFSQETLLHGFQILSWMQLPYIAFALHAGSSILFHVDTDGCRSEVPGLMPDVVPPGSRRNLVLTRPCARLQGPNGFDQPVPTLRRLMLRSLDEEKAEIQLAELVSHGGGVTIAGSNLKLTSNPSTSGQLVIEQASELQRWTCPCGRWTCSKEHRLSEWDPAGCPPNASLRTFLWTAVKGPGNANAFHVGEFVQGMYYALLREGV